MNLANSVLVRAEPFTIYPIAADVANWPVILPHYRWVRVISQTENRRVVVMAAWRDLIPIRWLAEQALFPDEPRITFRHLRGPTKGMEVEWSFEPTGEGTRVRIHHELKVDWPVIGKLGEWVIGQFFIASIAQKTLNRVKQLAEVEQERVDALTESSSGGDQERHAREAQQR